MNYGTIGEDDSVDLDIVDNDAIGTMTDEIVKPISFFEREQEVLWDVLCEQISYLTQKEVSHNLHEDYIKDLDVLRDVLTRLTINLGRETFMQQREWVLMGMLNLVHESVIERLIHPQLNAAYFADEHVHLYAIFFKAKQDRLNNLNNKQKETIYE